MSSRAEREPFPQCSLFGFNSRPAAQARGYAAGMRHRPLAHPRNTDDDADVVHSAKSTIMRMGSMARRALE